MPLTEYSEAEAPAGALIRFIFRGNDILVRQDGELPWECRLADAALFSRLRSSCQADACREEGTAGSTDNSHPRSFTDTEYGYAALMLDEGTSADAGARASGGESLPPDGYAFIPLRDFFWQTKTAEEQERGLSSRLGSLAARAHGFLGLLSIYRFCPRCGSRLAFDLKETAMRCSNPACGRLDFPHIEPAVIILVTRGTGQDEELLLVKNRNFRRDFYGCVSGFVEMGESIEACAVREVREETGIEIQNLRYVGSQAWPFPDQLMLAFTADYKSGEIVRQESELLDAGWFRRDRLPSIPYPGSVAYNLITGLF